VKSDTETAVEKLVALCQKLKQERIALGRRIEGIEMALDALGYKTAEQVHSIYQGRRAGAPKGKRTVTNTTGHTIKYLVREALYGVYPQGMPLKDIGTYLARRGVDPVLTDSISVSLTALKAKDQVQRTEQGLWRMTESGRGEMDHTRSIPA